MAGLTLGMLVACMDGTIVGTCANVIATDLNGLDLYSWMITAYLLCESAMVPIAGKMSDRYGRKPVFLIGIGLFAVGSMAAGLSPDMTCLLIFRGMQGLGGGILMPVAMAAVADFYSPQARGKMQGMLGATFGLGSGIGPLVGGVVCNSLSWHWVFYINVPLILISLALVMTKFPEQQHGALKRIDIAGIVCLTALIFDVLLYFQWITEDMTFTDKQSLAMIALAVVLLLMFIFIERRVEDPIISPKLIHNKVVVKSAAYMFIMGMAMIGTLTFNAMYLMNVFDMDAMECGINTLPLVFGMMATSMASGMMVHKTGYRVWILVGSGLMVVSLLLLSTIGPHPELWVMLCYMFLFGLGLGCVNSTVMISVQNNANPQEMGMTTSAVSLMRNIGSTVGTAVFSLIIASSMNSHFAETVFAPLAEQFGVSGTGLLAFRYIPGLPEGIGQTVTDIFGNGVCEAYLLVGLVYVFAVVLAVGMERRFTISDGNREE